MSKVVTDLLLVATAMLATNDSAELKDCIEAVEFLGEDADGRTQEYKDLKAIVEEIQAKADADGATPTPPTADAEVPKKKLSYMGIKMIGNRWYSMKDKYKKAFETADECAEHFNK